MPNPMLIAILPLGAAAIVDIRSRRLPDSLIALAAVIAGTVSVLSGTIPGALIGALVFCAPLLAAHLINPAGLGFGDVKLGAVLGLILGSIDWRLVLPALGLGCVAALMWLLVRRVQSLAFGPALVGGATAVAVLGGLS